MKMRPLVVIGLILAVLGLVALAVPSITFFTTERVADGGFFPKEAPVAFKLVPLIKHTTYIPGGLFFTSFTLIMNQAKWDQISAADRAAIEKTLGEPAARRAGKAWDAADARGEKAVRDAIIPVATADAKFIAEIKQSLGGLEKAWLDKAKAKGADGPAILAAIKAELAGAPVR